MRSSAVIRILLAQGLSSLGSSMSTVALAIMVFAITGSVLHMGGIMAASTIPLVATAWIGGAFLDRYSARNVMVLADVGRAVVIFSVPFLAQSAVGLIYVAAGLMGTLTALFSPGQVKIVGEVVDRRDLVRVNSYLGVARDGAELLGYLAGGVVASTVGVVIFGERIPGYTVAFIADAASYLASALLLLGVPRGVGYKGVPPKLGALIVESPAVLGRLWRHSALRANLLLAVFAAGAIMMYVPNSYGLALDVFEAGSIGLATLEVFVAVGLITGGLLISRMRLKGDKNRYVFCSLLVMAACYAAVSLSNLFWLSIPIIALAGAANVGVFVPSITMFQEISPSPEKGRLIALRAGFGQLGATLGFVIGGLLGAKLGIKPAFFVTGVATIVIATVIYVPYRLSASRRARVAWSAAMDSGAKRITARQIAEQAAYTGVVTPMAGPDSRTAVAAWATVADTTAESVGSEV